MRNGVSGAVWGRGIVGLGIALCLGFPAVARAQQDAVKLGDLLAISNAAVYIAVEKGYYKEEGIRNDISTFASAARSLPALVAGELEVSVGTPSVGLFNAIREGAGFRIVADKGQARAGTGYFMLVVRKDLVASGQVKSVRDLKGRKVSLFAKGTNFDYLLGKMAEEVGMTIRDFALTYLAAPSQLTAFETQAIDAAITVEPWAARFQEKGLAVRFRTPDQVKGLGPVQTAVVMYSGKFIEERRPVAQRWMAAYLKGAEFFNAKGSQNPEVLSILEKYTKVPANTIKAAIPHYQARNGKPILESLADMIDWFVANGYMEQRIGVDKVVDLSFLK